MPQKLSEEEIREFELLFPNFDINQYGLPLLPTTLGGTDPNPAWEFPPLQVNQPQPTQYQLFLLQHHKRKQKQKQQQQINQQGNPVVNQQVNQQVNQPQPQPRP